MRSAEAQAVESLCDEIDDILCDRTYRWLDRLVAVKQIVAKARNRLSENLG